MRAKARIQIPATGSLPAYLGGYERAFLGDARKPLTRSVALIPETMESLRETPSR
jgi:hypothetical protein